MELNVKTAVIGTEETLLDTAVENPFDLDVHLPEYYPDVRRILKCTVRPNILSVSAGTDRVTAEGSGVMRILYAAEENRVVAFEQTFPFSRSTPFRCDDPNAAVTAYAQTDFVNCRATGQRRAGVHGVISVRFHAVGLSETQLVVGTDEDALQLRTRSVSTRSLQAAAERSFAMSEVVEVGADDPPIGQILRSDAAVRIDAVKAVKDKLLIKGELSTETLYAPEGSDEWVRFRHTMPVSQIVEAQGVAEDNLQDVTLRVASLETTPKADGSGETRLLEIAVRLSAGVRSFGTVQADAVRDAYSTQGVLQPQYGDVTLRTSAEQFSETVTVKQTFELSAQEASQLLDVSYDRVQTTFRMDGDTAVVDCAVPLGFLSLDEQGASMYTEKQAEFACRKILTEKPESALCDPLVQIVGCKGMLTSNGSVEVRLEALFSGTVYAVTTERLLLSASVADTQDEQPRAAMTIYFSDAGESVWEIARRYGTTVAAVQEENGLSDETVPEKRMLVIPTAAQL